MLLIDGVRYLETPPKDEDALEQMVIEHAKDIFGEDSIYLDKKYKLKSPAGIGSIPDGFAITFGVQNQWHIVEVELSSHDPYSHVTPQLDKFLSGIESGKTTDGIITALYSAINENEYDKIKLRKVLGNNEIHDFISHLIKDNQPVITVIIENNTPILQEALKKYTPKKIVEFRTLTRENADTVHAHLFEPVYTEVLKPIIVAPDKGYIPTPSPVPFPSSSRITLKNLLETGILKAGQLIYREYNSKRFEGKILAEGLIELNGKKFPSPSGAASSITPNQVDGWGWWNTTDESGQRILLDNLREKYKQSHNL